MMAREGGDKMADWTAGYNVYYQYHTQRRFAMRNGMMALLPLALAMSVSACQAEKAPAGKESAAAAPRAGDAGPVATRDFALSGFTGVRVAGPDDVTIRRGDAFSISAKGPQAVLDELEIRLDGDMLAIGRKREGFSIGRGGGEDADIRITMPRLTSVRLTGSGEIDADAVEGDAVEASVTGSGDLRIGRLTAKRAAVTLSGSGDVDIEGGTVGEASYKVTGSGGIDAEPLAATALDVSITGSGDVEAQATGTAEVRILGAGDATVTGGARCTTRVTGSGTATCR